MKLGVLPAKSPDRGLSLSEILSVRFALSFNKDESRFVVQDLTPLSGCGVNGVRREIIID